MQPAENSLKRTLPTWLAAFAALSLVALNVARIINVPVTHDEALTFIDYINRSVADIANSTRPSANNHILNTLLAKFFTGVFNDSQFFLRLDALLAQLAYLLFTFLISRRVFENKWLVLLAFLLFNLNPFLFDFWGLCRGYGLSLAFMMGSIYYLLRYMSGSKGYLPLSFLFAIAAIYSNFALLNFLPALIAAVVASVVFFRKKGKYGFWAIELPVMSATIAAVYLLVSDPIQNNIKAGQFYYGGEVSLRFDTVGTLIGDSLFMDSYGPVLELSYLLIAVMFFSGVYLLYILIKNRSRAGVDICVASWTLLVVCCLSIILQHQLLGTKYLISRTALFLLPLYVFHLCSLLALAGPKKRAATMAFVTAIAAINFAVHINVYDTWSWRFDRYDLAVLQRALKKQREPQKKIKLYAYWTNVPTTTYYASTMLKDKFEPFFLLPNKTLIPADTTFDYYYVPREEAPYVPSVYGLDTILGDYYLMEKKIKRDGQHCTIGTLPIPYHRIFAPHKIVRMKVFISGASGLVGSNCLKHFIEQGWETVGSYYSFQTDDTVFYDTLMPDHPNNFDVAAFKPDVIVHCGALTHVDYCESNEQESYDKTVQSTINLIKLANECKARLVYISTDYVFDGKDGPYTEDAPVNPLSVYARHKLEAEQRVLRDNAAPLVLRVTNVYGNELRGQNFVARIVDQCTKNQKLTLKLPYDQYASPANAWDIARCMYLLLRDNKGGIYHIGGTDYMNRIDLALRVLSYFPNAAYELIPMNTEDLKQPAARPLLGGFIKMKFSSEYPEFLFGNVDSYMKEVLAHTPS